jgi:arylsulfatase A-like enzyme
MNSPCLRSVAFPSFLLALVAAILPTAVRAAEDHPIPARPNIVFILADDLGYGDLASYGHLRIKTPHLDQLAAEGTRFTQYYTHAVCSPSRVALLTGQHPARWQVYAPIVWLSVNAKNNMADWLDPRAPSLPRALQQAGYHTALFGKWHLGGGSGRSFTGKAINSPDAPLPNAYGYDETRTYVGNGPGWRGTTPVAEPHDLYVVEDDEFVRWSSKLIADEAIAFLDRRKAAPREPFLLQVHFHDPHVPLRPTEEMEKPYADITDLGARAYYAVVTDMDYHVGRILSQLDQLGLRDNTLVIFTSDNGTPARQGSRDTGRRRNSNDTAGSNGPLRGWKWHLYEGGVRVPFIARWPGVIDEGKTDTSSVLNVCDFAPTFAHLAGARMPEGYVSDGVDITEALTTPNFSRQKPMYWYLPVANRRGPPIAVRDGNWKLLMEPDGTNAELFDLSSDPNEQHNLVAQEPAVVERLAAQTRRWLASLPRSLDRVGETPGKGPYRSYISAQP